MITRSSTQRWTNSLAGLLIGAVVLVFATAILAGAVSSGRAEGKVIQLSGQVSGLRDDNAALRSDNTALRNQVTALGADNRVLRKQNKQMNQQLAALVTYLKAQGIQVPDIVTRDTSGSTTRPKAPAPVATPKAAPTGPASPGPPPVTPSPSPGVPSPACALVPGLCPTT